MFTRVMCMVLAIIVVITAGLTVICGVAMRNQQIDSRLNELIGDAEDIAWLAAQTSDSLLSVVGFGDDTGRKLLNRKAGEVHREYGAYVAVVDRRGNVMDNMRTTYEDDPAFAATLRGNEIREGLTRILNGESISLRSAENGDPTFTVGVPFVRRNVVEGAVFIQTKAQTVESDLFELIRKVVPVAIGVLILSGIVVFLYVRSVMKPLRALTEASGKMANGEFGARVPEDVADPEIRDVAKTFNGMAERLEDVERSRREFVANVSHELRTPITSIKGFAEGMADGVIPAEDHPQYLRLVARESNRLSELIDALLALSRLEREDAKPDLSDFDINELLRVTVIRRMNELDAKDLEVECAFDRDPCPVCADRARIEQVAVNLLDNAIRFTPKGGKITLETAYRNGKAEVTVRDNGTGVLPEDRPHVFERFFTADRAHTAGKGYGLGLSICKLIMDLHGETIELLDTEEGAAFRFTLAPGTTDGEANKETDEETNEEELPDEPEVERAEAGTSEDDPEEKQGNGDPAANQ